MSDATAFPLAWPHLWPRFGGYRHRSKFKPGSMQRGTEDLLRQLKRMGVPDYNVTVSTNVKLRGDGLPLSNQRNPQDPGVAVYFKLKQRPMVLACDRWPSVEENLWAICKHVEALRGQERWGVGSLEQAFTGYQALPAKGETSRTWRAVLGLPAECSYESAREQFRDLCIKHHPDRGGDPARFKELSWAIAEAKLAIGPKE